MGRFALGGHGAFGLDENLGWFRLLLFPNAIACENAARV